METQNTNTEVFESIGSSVRSEIARRIGEDRWFKRSQYRDARFGYKWTPWTTTAIRPGVVYNGDDPASYSYSECCSGYLPAHNVRRVRLPRD